MPHPRSAPAAMTDLGRILALWRSTDHPVAMAPKEASRANVVNGRSLLRVVGCLPSGAELRVHAGAHWAGVVQAPREETAECIAVVSVDYKATLWGFEGSQWRLG